MRAPRLLLLSASAALAALAGCSGGGDTEADCAEQVRLDGVVYTGWSVTKRDAQPLGDAERASCDDTSREASGSYFADSPESVPVWSFEGYSPDEVLGVRFDKESYTIFIAESLPDGDRDSLLAELGGAKY